MTVNFQLPGAPREDGTPRYLEVPDDQAEFWDNAGLKREGANRVQREEDPDEGDQLPDKHPIELANERGAESALPGEIDPAANEEPAAQEASTEEPAQREVGVTRKSAKGGSNG